MVVAGLADKVVDGYGAGHFTTEWNRHGMDDRLTFRGPSGDDDAGGHGWSLKGSRPRGVKATTDTHGIDPGGTEDGTGEGQ